MKNKLSILIILIFFVSPFSYSQKIRSKKIVKEFNNSNKLYVLKSDYNNKKLHTYNEDEFSFIDLVRVTWNNKDIIEINENDYNDLNDIKNNFFISITNINVTKHSGSVVVASQNSIIIQKGKVVNNDPSPNKVIYLYPINIDEINKGILPNRMQYSVTNLKYLLDNYDDNSKRDITSYKSEGYKNILKENTLYVRESKINDKLKNLDKLKKVYKYKIKLVNDYEWEEAVKTNKKGVVFIDYVSSNNYVNIYNAYNGKLIIGSVGVITSTFELLKGAFGYNKEFFTTTFK